MRCRSSTTCFLPRRGPASPHGRPLASSRLIRHHQITANIPLHQHQTASIIHHPTALQHPIAVINTPAKNCTLPPSKNHALSLSKNHTLPSLKEPRTLSLKEPHILPLKDASIITITNITKSSIITSPSPPSPTIASSVTNILLPASSATSRCRHHYNHQYYKLLRHHITNSTNASIPPLASPTCHQRHQHHCTAITINIYPVTSSITNIVLPANGIILPTASLPLALHRPYQVQHCKGSHTPLPSKNRTHARFPSFTIADFRTAIDKLPQ